jgi:pentatricopeptide repeat protein
MIHAFAKHGDHVEAERFLNMMVRDFFEGNEGAKPDFSLFDTVIKACTTGCNIDTARAEFVLRRMWFLHNGASNKKFHDVRPRMKSYLKIILACIKTNDLPRAKQFMREMKVKGIGDPPLHLSCALADAWKKQQQKQSHGRNDIERSQHHRMQNSSATSHPTRRPTDFSK